MSKKDEKEITVIAEVMVMYEDRGMTEIEIIKGFDASWHRALALPLPVTISFNRWVRKDSK